MSAGRRLVVVGVLYAVGAVLLLPFVHYVERLLFLPPLFLTLAHAMLIVGFPLALLAAWHYPNMGGQGGDG